MENIITNEDSTKYSGLVSVSLVKNNQVTKEYTFKNSGTGNLFEFLASSLCGDWIKVKDLVPSKIVLFSASAEEQSSFNNAGDEKTPFEDKKEYWADNTDEPSKSQRRSYSVTFDTTPVIELLWNEGETATETRNAIGAQVTLHFRIPFLYIFSSTDSIYKVALYKKIINDLYIDQCAYFRFVDNDGKMSGIEIPEDANNYTIIINWTLKFFNK